jgi:hypothetical protein
VNQSPFYIGQRLDNGATILAVRPDGRESGNGRLETFVLLCIVELKNAAAMYDPYVVWYANEENGTFTGHYTDDINDAVREYNER